MTKIAQKQTAAEELAATTLGEPAGSMLHESREAALERYTKRFKVHRRCYSKLTRSELEILAAELAALAPEWKRQSDFALKALTEAKGAIEKTEAKAATAAALIALRRSQNSLGGKKARANSPKAIDKQDAYVFWQEWKTGKHPRIKDGKQFARRILSKPGTSLVSEESIRRWMREWSKKLPK